MALNLQNAKEKFINALFGVPTEIEQAEGNVQYQYPTQRQADFMQGLPSNKDLLEKIQASPYNQGYTDQEIINRVAQGQNFGLPEIANEQKEWGIKLPRANNELDEEAVKGNYLNVYQPKLQTGTATTPRQGGFFNDLAQGYQENATQGFNVQNWAPQNKGLATKIGEGLGTLARFYDKPIGRMAVATGLSMLTDEVNPLQEGIRAYVGRQTNMTKDKAYRQNLQQMGYTPEEIDSIPGIVNDQVYTNLIRAKQLQDNAEYRNMMLQNQQAQNELMNQYRQEQLNYQRMQDIQDRAMKEREFNYRASQDAFDNKIALANLEAKKQGKENKNIGNLNAVNTQLNRFQETFKNMPGKFESNTLGRVRAATGFQTEQEANFNSQRQLLFNKIARDLGGEKGVLSDQDIKRIEGALPSYTDSLEQKNAKMSAIYDLLNDRLSVEGGSIGEQSASNDPLGIL
jgi:hypothetical protein